MVRNESREVGAGHINGANALTSCSSASKIMFYPAFPLVIIPVIFPTPRVDRSDGS